MSAELIRIMRRADSLQICIDITYRMLMVKLRVRRRN